jgi:hypothetical protein
VSNIADNSDLQPREIVRNSSTLPNCVGIKQRLCRVSVPSITGIDNCCRSPTSNLPGNSTRPMSNHKRIDTHCVKGFDSVSEAFAFVNAGGGNCKRHGVSAQAFRSEIKTHSSPR